MMIEFRFGRAMKDAAVFCCLVRGWIRFCTAGLFVFVICLYVGYPTGSYLSRSDKRAIKKASRVSFFSPLAFFFFSLSVFLSVFDLLLLMGWFFIFFRGVVIWSERLGEFASTFCSLLLFPSFLFFVLYLSLLFAVWLWLWFCLWLWLSLWLLLVSDS